MPLWLIHLLAAATALALAEHWLRYVLVERKRHRRAVDRLERIRRNREAAERRRDDAEWAKLRAHAYTPEAIRAYADYRGTRRQALAAQQQSIIDDYNLNAAARGAAPGPSGLGLGQSGAQQDRPWLSNTGTMQYDRTVIDPMFGTRVGWVPVGPQRQKPRGPFGL